MKKIIFSFFIFSKMALGADIQNLETCYSPEGRCDQKLIGMINSSKKTLEVAIYSIDHSGIAASIIAAKDRGVVVRMVVDKGQSKKKKSQVGDLLKAKVPLKYGNVKGIMHNKFSIVDGIIMETGSFNYKNNSTNDNAENQIYITDTNVLKSYQTNFDKLWSNGLQP